MVSVAREAPAAHDTNGILQLTVGGAHAYLLDEEGVARCWGADSDIQLGGGHEGWTQSPIEIIGLESGLTAANAGGFATCAITNSGGAACWGSTLGLGHNAQIPKSYRGLETGVRQASVAGRIPASPKNRTTLLALATTSLAS